MNDSEVFLRIEGLTKRFGYTLAVDNIDLSIHRGEIFALLGASGCGKSTLLRMLAGLKRPPQDGSGWQTKMSPTCPRMSVP